jgi:hypothetical protein
MAKRGLMAIAAISVLLLWCPTGHAASQEPTPRDKACSEARPKQQCGNEAKDCHYKFTVKEVNGQKVTATYPPSVWSVTKKEEKEKETEKEKEYKKKYEKYQFPIDLKQGSAAPAAGNTYFFTRCPEKEFSLGEQIDPNDPHEPTASKP